MTTHNQINYGGPIVDAIALATGLDASQGGVERTGETLTPTLDIWSLPEWAILRDECLGAFFNSAGAIAAEFSFIGIGLPSNSTNILIVDRIGVRGAMAINIGHQARSVVAATGTLVGTARARDQRFSSNQGNFENRAPPVETWSGSDPGSITGSQFEEVVATAAQYFECLNLPVVVKPGGVFVVQGGTVNVSIQVNFRFRLRAALPGELNPV